MSAVQAGGGKGSGQRPGGAPGGRPPARKPSPVAAGTTAKKPGQRPAGSGRPPGGKTASGGRTGGKTPARTSGYRPPTGAPRRFSPSTLAFVAVAVVVLIIVVFVVVKITGSSSSSSSSTVSPIAPKLTPAPAGLVAAVTGVSAKLVNAVGVPSSSLVAPPTIKTGQPALTLDGKPGAVFVGGEFCPLCAAERWAIIMAFGKFGTFSNLQETTSSPWDTDPATATFSFYGATYSSPYITLDTAEYESNDTNGLGTRHLLQPLTSVESNLWQKYDQKSGFPFLDIGNQTLVLSPQYDPAVLKGLDQTDIASRFTNASDPVTQSIVGAANYLTAGICAATGQKPASVCSASVVQKSAKAMGLS